LFDFNDFDTIALVECRRELREVGASASSVEDAADKLVRFMYESFRNKKTGRRSCALVRFYMTQPFARLPLELQEFVRSSVGDQRPPPEMRCLTLMGTAGVEEAWNSRARSEHHKAIALPSAAVVEQAPMVAQLIKQLGVKIEHLVRSSDEIIVDRGITRYNVFHVEEAEGSPYIPAQEDFVIPYGVKTVLGFGGLLPVGELFAMILFSRDKISENTAKMFRTLTLVMEIPLLRNHDQVFSS